MHRVTASVCDPDAYAYPYADAYADTDADV
jgi:hypothetical protein